jgi:hypothetical protein
MQDQDNLTAKKAQISHFLPHEVKGAAVSQERQSEQSRLERLTIRLREAIQAKQKSQPEAA